MMTFPTSDPIRVHEISEEILKSMLNRSYPAVNATHYFKKYAIDGKPDPQFMHAMAMMEKGGIIRMDHIKKPFSVTFVLMEDGKPKMHHMIDDDYESLTFGALFNDPYEGDKKRVYCYKHIMNDEKTKDPDCEKCELERLSQICKSHKNVRSSCRECKEKTALVKKMIPKDEASDFVTEVLKVYKKENWSFS